MSNHFYSLLSTWQAQRDATEWVLGTIYRTQGSSYRKAGAHMLFNGWGQQYGLLSGGCLEADIQREAMQVMQTGRNKLLRYDATDEDDVAYQLGIGCGGIVDILLQPIVKANHFLAFESLLHAAEQGQAVFYYQKIDRHECRSRVVEVPKSDALSSSAYLTDDQTLVTPILPQPALIIMGGGRDAEPLAAMAQQLDWRVSLWDSRSAYARPDRFPQNITIYRHESALFNGKMAYDAMVIMTHNVSLDASALNAALQMDQLRYLALLGPRHRKERVILAAGYSDTSLPLPLHSPAGYDLGGHLPEQIALSILSECHAVLFNGSGRTLSSAIRPEIST